MLTEKLKTAYFSTQKYKLAESYKYSIRFWTFLSSCASIQIMINITKYDFSESERMVLRPWLKMTSYFIAYLLLWLCHTFLVKSIMYPFAPTTLLYWEFHQTLGWKMGAIHALEKNLTKIWCFTHFKMFGCFTVSQYIL